MKRSVKNSLLKTARTAGICCLSALLASFAVPAAAFATPTDVSAQTDNEGHLLTYHDVKIDLNDVGSDSVSRLQSDEGAELPSSYSSVDIGPSIRDQGSYGACWAFSAIAAVEYSLAKQGLATTDVDQAERQLAYFFYNRKGITDPLGNTTGDYTEAVEDSTPQSSSYLDNGGNGLYAMWHLLGWCGTTEESEAPYSTLLSDYLTYANDYDTFRAKYDLDSSLAYGSDSYHVQDVEITSGDDIEGIKQMVYENGAVSMSYYESGSYCNNATNAYYCPYSFDTNHAVTIVGWDDNYSVSNFKASHRPSSDGAWLVRNSWGTYSRNDGYFWLSYEDAPFCNDNVFSYTAASADNFDNNYQYDGSCSYAWSTEEEELSYANVYTAKANDGGKELLSAVGFGTYSYNVDYSIQIYTDLTDPEDPTSGTPRLTNPVRGTLEMAGYHTIDLGEDIELESGETFAVVVTPSAGTAMAVDTSYPTSWIVFVASSEAGQSFCGSAETGWADESAEGTTFRIKAYTNNVEKPEAAVSVDAAEVEAYGMKATVTATANFNATSYRWQRYSNGSWKTWKLSTSNSCQVPVNAATASWQWRVIAKDESGEEATSTFNLNVNSFNGKVTVSCPAVAFMQGTTVTATADFDAVFYKWQRNVDGEWVTWKTTKENATMIQANPATTAQTLRVVAVDAYCHEATCEFNLSVK